MHHDDDDWAVFWCSLLGPILLDEVEPGERRAFLKNLTGERPQHGGTGGQLLTLDDFAARVFSRRERSGSSLAFFSKRWTTRWKRENGVNSWRV